MVGTNEMIIHGRLKINPEGRVALIDEQETVLTRMEFDVLCFLASNPNIAFTREQIYEAVSKDNFAETAYVIKDVIYRLRNKLDIENIQTLYGYGYKFIAVTENLSDIK